MARATVLERFMSKVCKQPDGCWIWQGNAVGSPLKYGAFWFDGRDVKAHRWSYEHFVGPIPAGLTLDHLCRVPLCVNPEHLEPVPLRENILRGNGAAARAARRTHCDKGHPYDEANTYVAPGSGRRVCRTCYREWNAAYKRRQKGR
jgi:HNH endonuclease